MIPRYEKLQIDRIFSDESRTKTFDKVELAAIEARVNLGMIPREVHSVVGAALAAHPCDIEWWKRREKETDHDVAAYIDERYRWIPVEFQAYFHQYMTSYDVVDPTLTLMVLEAASLVTKAIEELLALMREKALKYRFTPMLGRSHGQWAKLCTFGGEIVTWLTPLFEADGQLRDAIVRCRRSRMSGAVGNYGGGMTPEIEAEALRILGLKRFSGATQIASRIIHAPLVHALTSVAEAIAKIAMDFRLGARSGTQLWHEPFKKKQKGSSAMPHKKNTIKTEQMEGMLRMALGYETSLKAGAQTWERRSIEQSCVERVMWPDLFHVLLHMISVMHGVLKDMVVYPDNMLEEIWASRGTYASDEAKNFIAEEFGKRGIPFEEAYRVIQLAAFCLFRPSRDALFFRESVCENLLEADDRVMGKKNFIHSDKDLRSIVMKGNLFALPDELDATEETVERWNALLRREIFSDEETRAKWEQLFLPSHLLKGEGKIFKDLFEV